VAGAVAVFCRQTNAIWVCFILGTTMVRDFESVHGESGSSMKVTLWFAKGAGAGSSAGSGAGTGSSASGSSATLLEATFVLPLAVLRFALTMLKEWQRVLMRFW
jgi:hypothetical protein